MRWTSASAPWSRASFSTHKPLPVTCAAFEEIDEVSRLTLDGVRNLLDAQLSGNNREGCRRAAPTSTTIC